MDHPRPQLRRDGWRSLDGPWQFAFDDAASASRPEQVVFDRTILVPYAPETAASGIGREAFTPRCWYARTVPLADLWRRPDDRMLLHFGAVDYHATVWVDGRRVMRHTGGHSPFTVDVTDWIAPGADAFELAVLAEDDPFEMDKPRGKQDWLAEPHSIWYPRTTGIWRTVWVERVPASHLSRLRWSADVSTWTLTLDARISGLRPGLQLQVSLSVAGLPLVHERVRVNAGDMLRSLHLPDPGIDDARDDWMWSPEHPQLIDARVELLDADGQVVDEVVAYTAMRSVRVEGSHFMLNDRPYVLRMVLDQGYWPAGQMTADAAQWRQDIELVRRMGFNGVRKHQKSEDPRWLYWADTLGLAVWAEMPAAYAFSDRAIQRITDEWRELVERDLSQPCVLAWVPVNESWGVPALPRQPRQVDLVQALYHLTRSIDGTRPVVGNDGWEMPCSDIVAIHDYTDKPLRLMERYGTREAVAQTLRHERPGGGRRLLLPGFDGQERPVMLTEFGGIAPLVEGELGWGYSVTEPGAEFGEHVATLLEAVCECRGLSGFCYTQLTDTYLEKNGLLTPERVPKVDPMAIARAVRADERFSVTEYARNPMGYSRRWLRRNGLLPERPR